MNTKNFNNIVDNTVDSIRSTLQNKAAEYANNNTDERLANFKDANNIVKNTASAACVGMALKHYVSIGNIFTEIINEPNKVISYNLWKEKKIDLINYLILLEACMIEEDMLEQLPVILQRDLDKQQK